MILYIIINMSARGRFSSAGCRISSRGGVVFFAGGNRIGLGGGSIIRRSREVGVKAYSRKYVVIHDNRPTPSLYQNINK